MPELSLRLSKAGLLAAGLFLGAAVAVFAWIFFLASTHSGDSGESGVLLIPFAMPWIVLIPKTWLGPGTGLGAILLNAFILYLLFGGLRFSARSGH